VSRLFEDFLNTYPFRTVAPERGDTWKPAVDILEKDGNLVIRADMPGISEKDIDLKLEGNVLTLKGERKPEPGEDRNSYYLAESFYGTFTRSFTLPQTVDAEKNKGGLQERNPYGDDSTETGGKAENDSGFREVKAVRGLCQHTAPD